MNDTALREYLALYGSDEPLPRRLMLRAGPLSFALIGGRFGPLCVSGHEVWHGMAFLFRDAGWGTPEPVFGQVRHTPTAQGFQLELDGHIPCAASDVAGTSDPRAHIRLHLSVHGHEEGHVHLRAQATPSHNLRTQRCGWVLMHPMSAAGSALEVLHVDGRISRSTFPEQVAAWPPFMGVQGIRHEYAPGHWAQAVFDGEDHELEDQRNNADASFKTYSRSNMMPRPYLLTAGQSLTRELHLQLMDRPPSPKNVSTARTSLVARMTPAPTQLGLAITPDMSHHPEPWVLAMLKQWRPRFLHLTVWHADLQAGVDWAGVQTLLHAAGAGLRLDLCSGTAPDNAGLQEDWLQALAEVLASSGIAPVAVAALPCGAGTAQRLRRLFPGARIGGGTPHFFAQLNRLDVRGGEDFMSFTVCPTVHGTEEESLMQGLQSLPSMLNTARQRHPGRELHLGPSWLFARASPLGKQPQSDGQRRTVLARRDPRTRGLFGAAWLLGHLAQAVSAGVQALTLPPMLGEGGWMWQEDGVWHDTPTAAMLEVMLGWTVLHPVTPGPTDGPPPPSWVTAIAGSGPNGTQALLANLSGTVQTLHWPQLGPWHCMDARSWAGHQDDARFSPWRPSGDTAAPLTLGPYALGRIDLAHFTGA